MLDHAERTFKTYGLPYTVRDAGITWIGDSVTREAIMEPVLDALNDSRVTGARDEFR
jgi:hypothetical protein